tara:strand:- start:2526 stop:2921 length:396 start_codon:yes stop_codon:yes gene_type:complete
MKNLLLIAVIFIYSCEDDGLVPNYGCTNLNAANYDSNANVDDGSCMINPTFDNYFKDLFINSCSSCHSSEIESVENLTNVGWVNPGDPDNSLLFQRISLPVKNPESMPQNLPNLNSVVTNNIKKWIEDGCN